MVGRGGLGLGGAAVLLWVLTFDTSIFMAFSLSAKIRVKKERRYCCNSNLDIRPPLLSSNHSKVALSLSLLDPVAKRLKPQAHCQQ